MSKIFRLYRECLVISQCPFTEKRDENSKLRLYYNEVYKINDRNDKLCPTYNPLIYNLELNKTPVKIR